MSALPVSLSEAVLSLLEEELDIVPDSEQSDLIEEGLLDSLAFVDLIVQLEVRFGVVVRPDHMEFDNFRSVDRIADYVVSQGGAPRA